MRTQIAWLCVAAVLLQLPLSAQCPELTEIKALSQQGPQGIERIRALFPSIARHCDCEQEVQAYACHYLGAAYYSVESLDSAIYYSLLALDLRESELPPDDLELGKTHFNLGKYLFEEGAFHPALDHLLAAEKIFEVQQMSLGLILSRKYLSQAYDKIGDYAKSVDYLALNVELAPQEGLWDELADSHLNWGKIDLDLHRYREGLEQLQQALDLYLEMEELEMSFNRTNLASCYVNFAVAYDGLGNFAEALTNYRLALRQYDSAGEKEAAAKCKVNIGYTLIRLGRFAEAREQLQSALETGQELQLGEIAGMAFDNLGDLALAEGHCQEAIAQYRAAIDRMLRLSSDWSGDDLLQPDQLIGALNKKHLLTYLFDLAQAWETCADRPAELDRALQIYLLADQLVDQMRQEHSAQGSKLFWREATRPLYEAALGLCYRLGDEERAFYFLEKSRAVLLLDALAANATRQLLPDHLARRELQLEKRVQEYRLKADQGGSFWLDSVLWAQAQLEEFERTLETEYPQLLKARYDPRVLSLDEARSLFLKKGTALVEYMLGDSDLYIWALLPGEEIVFRRIPVGQIQGLLTAYQHSIRELTTCFDPEDYSSTAYQLYRYLLADISEALPAKVKRVIVVPDGEIALIPFDALLDQPRYEAENFLVRNHLFQYSYSASVMARQQDRRPSSRKVLTVAPVFAGGSRGLAPLGLSDALLSELDLSGMQTLYGRAATTGAFHEAVADSYILNLITHAEAGGACPRIEFIDTALYLPELYAMQIPADLVLLGACETSVGEVRTGEGIMSLSRGFTYAGASSLISSLWKVNEGSTGEIIGNLYRNLLARQTKAEALWNAKRQYLAEAGTDLQLSPYYWAAFVYFGADGPVDIHRPHHWAVWLWGIGAIPVLFGFFWLLRQKRRSWQSVAPSPQAVSA